MIGIHKKIKVKINYWFDRLIDQCNLVLMGVIHFPFKQPLMQKITRFAGDLCVFIQSFPRLSAYNLQGENWKIIFIGDQSALQEIISLFFPDEKIQAEFYKRVPVWQVGKFKDLWLGESADLVICEESRINPFKVKASVKFSFPEWVDQGLPLPENLDDFLKGSRMRNKREQLLKADKLNTGWYYSQSENDFRFFHYNLYLPYISARHQDRALLSNYSDQYERWFNKGGLIMATENDELLAGFLCIKTGNIVRAIESGVLKEKMDTTQFNIMTYLIWVGIQWASQQKAEFFDLGGSRPYISNGSFRSKKRWGCKVARRSKIFHNFTCLGENIPRELCDHINSIGFIVEDKKEFLKVFITPEGTLSLQADPYL